MVVLRNIHALKTRAYYLKCAFDTWYTPMSTVIYVHHLPAGLQN